MAHDSQDPRGPGRARPGFWKRYRRYFLIAIAVYVLLMAFLLVFATSGQDEPFLYQIF
ncbi:DUF5989 family protein [Myxococcota bacterium]|nr:DUF5989 family protein [Myxococcota bacterium]